MKHRFASVVFLMSGLLWSAGFGAAEPPVAWRGTVDRAGTLHRIPLTEAIYRALDDRSPDHLRVTDAGGNPVAAELVRAERLFGRTTDRRQAVPLFTVPATAVDEAGDWNVSVSVDESGRIERVGVEGGRKATRTGMPSWLVDTGDLERPPERFELRWTGADAPFTGRLRVSGSDDLDRWREIESVVVAELSGDGHRLVRDAFELKRPYRYYRLVPDGLPAGWRLSEVTAVARMDAGVPLERRATTVAPETGGRETDAVYRLGGRMPVTGIRVRTEGPFVFHARFLAGAEGDHGRRRVGQTTFYSLRHEGALLENRYMAVATRRAPTWWLERDDRSVAPALAFEWFPDQIVFLPRKSGVHYVHVAPPGEPGPAGAAAGISAVLDSTGSRVESLPVVAIERARADGMAPGAGKRAVDWQRIALWSVLVLASVVLIFIGWRLMRPRLTE